MAKLNENIARVKADFRAIKGELVNKGASIPGGTPTSQYANIIKNMSTGSSEEAYEQGRQDVISKSKYIPKTAIGKVISLTDVSEVAHKVKVYGDNQEVDVCGKNLFVEDVNKWSNYSHFGSKWGFELPYGLADVTLSATLKSGYEAKSITMTLYVDNGDGTYKQLSYLQVTGNASKSYSLDATKKHIVLCLSSSYQSTVANLVEPYYWQLESGTTATPYEPYTKQTITATPVGTEIDSMCPNMTFITYSDAEANLLVDYYSSFGMAEKELAMWNSLTNYGAREVYSGAFSYTDYSGHTIPKGLCKPRQVIGNMFYVYQGVELPKGVDCSEFNVSTTTQSYHAHNTFAYSPKLKHIYDIGIPANVMNYTGTYRSCSALETIEIIRSAENTTFDTNCFNGCSKLTHVIFSGVIASDINLQWSPLLDEESLRSLVLCLRFSGDSSNRPTLTLHPDSWAKMDGMDWSDVGYSDVREYIAIEAGFFFA